MPFCHLRPHSKVGEGQCASPITDVSAPTRVPGSRPRDRPSNSWPLGYSQFFELKPYRSPCRNGVYRPSPGNCRLWNFLNEKDVAEVTPLH